MGFLTGKTAIITGGGRAVLSNGECGSIGYGIATAYAKEGANLVLTGRNVQKLTDAKEELEAKYGIKVLPVQADVSAGSDNEAIVQNVVKQAIDTFGRIDVLINNAQASASGVTIADHTTEQFDLAVYSCLYAAFYYMKACYPYQGRYPRTDQSRSYRVGSRWHQCQRCMSSGMDRTAGEIRAGISRCFQGKRQDASYGTLRRRGEGDRPRLRTAGFSRLQVYER